MFGLFRVVCVVCFCFVFVCWLIGWFVCVYGIGFVVAADTAVVVLVVVVAAAFAVVVVVVVVVVCKETMHNILAHLPKARQTSAPQVCQCFILFRCFEMLRVFF